jgi:hypothetical protein
MVMNWQVGDDNFSAVSIFCPAAPNNWAMQSVTSEIKLNLDRT